MTAMQLTCAMPGERESGGTKQTLQRDRNNQIISKHPYTFPHNYADYAVGNTTHLLLLEVTLVYSRVVSSR